MISPIYGWGIGAEGGFKFLTLSDTGSDWGSLRRGHGFCPRPEASVKWLKISHALFPNSEYTWEETGI